MRKSIASRWVLRAPVLGVGALAVIVCAVAWVLTLSTAELDRRDANDAVTELSHDALRFTEAIGYGGLIHHFKNYILRPDEPRIRAAAWKSYNRATSILGDLETAATELDLDAPLNELRAALNAYGFQIEKVPRLRDRGLGPIEIDAAVRVSDDFAIEQLHRLLAAAHARLSEREAAARRLERLAAVGFVAIVLGLAALALLVTRLRRADRQREMLERIVGVRTKVIEEQKARLEAALSKEKELNGLQRQFVSMVSHEFRTPLAIMDGKARQMSRRADGLRADEIRDRSDVIMRSVRRLIGLIESVLSTSRLEEGKVAFRPVETDIAAMLRESAAAAAELFPRHDVEVEVDPTLAHAVCDPTLMRQVVANLLSNAGKYSDPGAQLMVRGARDDDANEIRISVSDTGVGIPEDELARLCERFFRASTGTGRPGAGIGLYVVRSFVEMHGGRVEIESVEGEGATFHVILPDLVAPEQAAA